MIYEQSSSLAISPFTHSCIVGGGILYYRCNPPKRRRRRRRRLLEARRGQRNRDERTDGRTDGRNWAATDGSSPEHAIVTESCI